jgi:hypothetical protein
MRDLSALFAELDELAPSDEFERLIAGLEAPKRPGGVARRRGRRAAVALVAAGAVGLLLVALAIAAHSRSSDGPTRPTPPPGTAIVPDVRGKPILRAARDLQRAGFAVSVPAPGFSLSSQSPQPRVDFQSEPGGKALARGRTIALGVRSSCCIGSPTAAAGTLLIMPNVVGKPLDVAIRSVSKATGFYVVRVPGVPSTRQPILSIFRVADQRPGPGVDIAVRNQLGFRLPLLLVTKASSPEASVNVFSPVDPTAALVTTRIVPLYGNSPHRRVFEGLLAKPHTTGMQFGGKWWANVLAAGATATDGQIDYVGIEYSTLDLDKGRPSNRVSHRHWPGPTAPTAGRWIGPEYLRIKRLIRIAAAQQGFTVEVIAYHSTAAGPAAVVTVRPSAQDALAYLKTHPLLRIAGLEGNTATFVQVVDTAGHVLAIEAGVPNMISISWADPSLRCPSSSGSAIGPPATFPCNQ